MQNPPTATPLDAVVRQLAAELAATAAQRDRQGGHAAAQRQRIRDSGLLGLTVPAEYGGPGASWSTFYRVLLTLAEADSALAHVWAFHHLQLASIRLFGSAEQRERLLSQTLTQGWFWGNALNPLDTRTRAVRVDGGFVFDGRKSYSSGSVGSDRLLFSGWDGASGSTVIATVDTRHPGVSVQADWDAFGQRQTDSGTVVFEQVRVDDADILQPPGAVPTVRATLRTLVSQLILTHLFLGMAQGALANARRLLLERDRPPLFSSAERAADDPFVQQRVARLWLLIKPAQLQAAHAVQALDQAWDQGDALTADGRGRLAIEVIEARALAHQAALEVSSDIFELTGGRGTGAGLALDRFWRNARVHTLHDPIDYKHRDLGRYLIDGVVPTPSPYS